MHGPTVEGGRVAGGRVGTRWSAAVVRAAGGLKQVYDERVARDPGGLIVRRWWMYPSVEVIMTSNPTRDIILGVWRRSQVAARPLTAPLPPSVDDTAGQRTPR